MAVSSARQVGHLRLARRVLDHGGALGERGRHHEVLGAGHRDEVGADARALEPAGPRLHVAVLDGDLGAQLLASPSDAGRSGRTPMAQPPGSATRRGRSRATQRAQHEDGGAHGRDQLVRRLVARHLRHLDARAAVGLGRDDAAEPLQQRAGGASRRRASGTFSSTTGRAVSSAAHSAGSAAFLAALAATSPRRGAPPSMMSRVGISSPPVAPRRRRRSRVWSACPPSARRCTAPRR